MAANNQRSLLNPIAQKFIDKLAAQGGKPLYELSVADARQVLESLQAPLPVQVPADIEDITIPGGPKRQVSLRIVRPQERKDRLPVIMYFHGGGWILGSKQTHDRLIRLIAQKVGAAVVFVNFSRSPEEKYPVAIEEAYAATTYIAEHGAEHNLEGSQLAVAGDSVGGNMATVMAIMAKQHSGPRIAYQVLFYPVTDANFTTGSYVQYAQGPWLTKAAMEWFWDAYAPDQATREKITVSPLRASLQELTGLPPALVITDECDVLRDEGEAYAHKLAKAGVEVTAVRCLGICHDFVMLNALSETPAAKTALELAYWKLRQALGKK